MKDREEFRDKMYNQRESEIYEDIGFTWHLYEDVDMDFDGHLRRIVKMCVIPRIDEEKKEMLEKIDSMMLEASKKEIDDKTSITIFHLLRDIRKEFKNILEIEKRTLDFE